MSTEQITIAGEVFSAPVRYSEGHELTAGEASALNQTYHENLRNNFAKKVKEAKEAGSFDQAHFQSEFDGYAAEYQFGVRTGGGGGATRDPVMAEAMRIAKSNLTMLLKQNGEKISDYEASTITEAVKSLIETDPAILELAKTRLEEQRTIASKSHGNLLAGLVKKAAAPEAPAQPAPEPAQPQA